MRNVQVLNIVHQYVSLYFIALDICKYCCVCICHAFLCFFFQPRRRRNSHAEALKSPCKQIKKINKLRTICTRRNSFPCCFLAQCFFNCFLVLNFLQTTKKNFNIKSRQQLLFHSSTNGNSNKKQRTRLVQ